MPVIQLDLDSSDAVKGLKKYDAAVDKSEKNTESAFSKMRGHANNVGTAVGVMLAAVGAASLKFALHAVSMASSLTEAEGVFNRAFEGMLATAEEYAATLNTSYSLTQVQAKESLNTLQLVLRGMGLATDEAGEMSFKLAKAGAELGAAFGYETADVIRDIRSALSGSMETMDKYGIVIRQAQVNAKALEMGLAETTKEITQADRATATYALVMERAAVHTGTVAEEMEGYSGQLREAKKNVGDLTTAIGKQLEPAFTSILKAFNEWLSEGDRANKIVNMLIEGVRFLGNGFYGLELVLKGTIVVIAKMFETFTKLLTPVRILLDGLIAIGAIDYNPVKELQQITKDFTDSATEGFGTTVEKIDAFNLAMDRTKVTAKEAGDATKTATDKAKEGAKEAATEVKENLNPAEVELKEKIEDVTTAANESATALKGQAAAAKEVAAATKEIAEETEKEPSKASKAWSGGTTKFKGSAFMDSLSPAERAKYVQMTPGGRGDHYWDSGSPKGPMGYGDSGDLHSNLDRNLKQSESAIAAIMADRWRAGGMSEQDILMKGLGVTLPTMGGGGGITVNKL